MNNDGDEHLRELFLVRHAKSDWKEPTPDIERPIAEKGKKAATRLGQWLGENNVLPDYVLVSPAKRAQQTLKRLNLRKDLCTIETDETLYHADLDTLKSLLKQIPQQYERVMMIGHNPGFEALRQFLETKPDDIDPEAGLFPTASLAHFIMPHNWKKLTQGSGKLSRFIRPKDIKRIG